MRGVRVSEGKKLTLVKLRRIELLHAKDTVNSVGLIPSSYSALSVKLLSLFLFEEEIQVGY